MINVIYNKSDYEISQRKMEMFDKYLKVIQWGRRNPVKFMEIFFGLQFTDHQRYVLLSTWNTRYAVWLMSRNSGKCLELNTPVYEVLNDFDTTYDRKIKTIGDLKIGDKIYDENGKPTEVIHLNPIIFEDVYKVYFEDGEEIECNGEHLWTVYDNKKSSLYVGETQYIMNNFTDSLYVPYFNLDNDESGNKKITKIVKTNIKKPMRCITVSNETGLFLCGNNFTATHNSYLSAPYMMARSILIPEHKSYIMAPSGPQAQQTFSKIEDLAKNQISSVKSATSVFLNELMKANSGTDGFVHDKNSHKCELFNGSSIQTLNSIAKNVVGIRSHLNFYDEAGKIEREFFDLTEPFCTQDRDFMTGTNFNIECYPKQMPNQMIYASSAEGMDSRLYDIYKECALRMIGGQMEYFCCDITCELSLNPKMDGKDYQPLLSREVIDNALKMNEFRANREYFNKFDVSGGQDCLVKRITVLANSYGYHPVFENVGGKQYIIAYDPASKLDNSVIGIAELFEDEEKGYMLKMVNLINLVEKLPNGDKKVIQKPDQIEMLKELILKYNGRFNPDYINIDQLIIDAGSGGGGFDVAQFLLKDWTGNDGKKHIGFIDLDDKYLSLEKDKFPGACDKLTMANFKGQKVEIYQACQDMINQGLVMFPKSLNLRLEMDFEVEDSEGNIQIIPERMDSDEIPPLVEFDMMKEELVAMQKLKQGSQVKFDLLPSKALEGMHDDRADVCAMLCWRLSKIRAEKMLDVDIKTDGFSKLFNHKTSRQYNPFNGTKNPFLSDSSKNPFQ